jgi:hypothetical protein
MKQGVSVVSVGRAVQMLLTRCSRTEKYRVLPALKGRSALHSFTTFVNNKEEITVVINIQENIV